MVEVLSSKMYKSAENCPGEGESNKSSAPFSRALSGGTPPANDPGSIFAASDFVVLSAPAFAGLKYGIMASQRSIIGNAAFRPVLNATTSASHVE